MDEAHQTPFIRYQFSFNLETINLASLRKQFEGTTIPPEEKDPDAHLRSKLTNVYKAVQTYDKEAKVMKWVQKEVDEFLNTDVNTFPKDPIDIESYFEQHYQVY